MPNTRRSQPKFTEKADGASLHERLGEDDVRKIFDCVTEGKAPTGNITFSIVKLADKKLMLSPPPYEFSDGIYVLLGNRSKKVPSNLEYLVHDRVTVESNEICKWSLSGPGSKKRMPGALQQRYSYPRGHLAYSNTKGGSMWTMLDNAGNDRLDMRVFHVYSTLKRLSSSVSGSKSSAGGVSGSDSTDNSSTARSRKSQPLKKRIKMEEDRRVAKVNSMEKQLKRAAAYEEDVIDTMMCDQLGSPAIASFDMDTSLKITEDDIFGDELGYPFNPIPNVPSILSAARGTIQIPVPVSAGTNSSVLPPYAYHETSGTTPLPCSYDVPSQTNTNTRGNPLTLPAFSNKLNQLQDCIFNDIRDTESTEERAQKLAVLQNWAKLTANRPLQARVSTTVEHVSSRLA